MEPHAHANLHKKTHACSPNYYEMFWIMVFSFKSSAYLFSSSFTSSSLPSFSLFFLLLFLSKQFQTFLLPSSPSWVNPVASVPHFSPPSFPSLFLSSLWFSDFHSRLIHVHSLGAGPLLAVPALCSTVNHLTSANRKRAVCVSQRIPANMSPGGGKFVEKNVGERECACHVCVCFGTRPTHYVLFLNLTVGWQKTPFSERIRYISKPWKNLYAQLNLFWLKKYEIVEFIMG